MLRVGGRAGTPPGPKPATHPLLAFTAAGPLASLEEASYRRSMASLPEPGPPYAKWGIPSRQLVVVHDVTAASAAQLRQQYPHPTTLFRRLGVVRPPISGVTEMFQPLRYDPDFKVRDRIYQEAMEWSWNATRSWIAARDAGLPARLRIGNARLTYDQFYFEDLYLAAAYLVRLLRAERIHELVLQPNVPADLAEFLAALAQSNGTAARGTPPATYGTPWRRRLASVRMTGYLVARLPRWRVSRPQLPDGCVLVEAGSIQSVRNVDQVLGALAAKGRASVYLGLPGPRRRNPARQFYEIEWIAATARAELREAAQFVNLLSWLPAAAAVRAPLDGLLFQRHSQRLRRTVPADLVTAFDTPVLRGHVLEAVLRQFEFDMLFGFLCQQAIARIRRWGRYRAVVVTNPVTLTGRLCCRLKSQNTRLLLVQDGTVSNEIPRRDSGDFDFACLWGREFARLLRDRFGYPPDRLIVCGPQRPVLAEALARPPESPVAQAANTVLFAHQPATFGGATCGFALSWLAELAREQHWSLRFRPHPRAQAEDIAVQLARAQLPADAVTIGTSLAMDLAGCCLLVAEYSTTIFEAIARGVPVVVIDCEFRTDMALLGERLGRAFVTSPRELRAVVVALLGDPAARRSWADEQKAWLPEYLSSVPPSVAAARVAELAVT